MPRYAVFDSHDEFDVVKCPRFVADTREKAFALSRIIKITDKYVSFVWVVDYRRDIPEKEMNGSDLSFDCMNGTAKSGPVVIHMKDDERVAVRKEVSRIFRNWEEDYDKLEREEEKARKGRQEKRRKREERRDETKRMQMTCCLGDFFPDELKV